MFNNTILGVIYLIKHKTCDDKKVYVGSTTNLKKRIKSHEERCYYVKSKDYNYKLYKYIRENGGFYMYEIIILECYVCNFKYELHDREDDYIQMYDNNLNSKRAYLTREQNKEKQYMRHKKYRDENKEKINEKYKKYYDENKDKIKENKKKYRDENKDKIKENKKKYRDENKEKIKERISEKITCECGIIVSKNHIARHRKSLKHIAYIEKK